MCLEGKCHFNSSSITKAVRHQRAFSIHKHSKKQNCEVLSKSCPTFSFLFLYLQILTISVQSFADVTVFLGGQVENLLEDLAEGFKQAVQH